jgi:glycerol-3-phosphate acyltransferase PlsX
MTDGTALTGESIPGTVLSIDAMGGDEGPAAVVGGMAKAIERTPSSVSSCMATGPSWSA